MHLLSRPRRARRAHEWSAAKAVTFIVTLAATGSVTLAVREAGMSRKSAYALKGRDPAFAAAWDAALKARKGDKAYEADKPPVSPPQGDKRTRATPLNRPAMRRQHAEAMRDLFFARLADRNLQSASVLPGARLEPASPASR